MSDEVLDRRTDTEPDYSEAVNALVRAANQALGVIVEFGDLNGFRNLSDEELGKCVVGMAKSLANALAPFKNMEDA